MVSVSLFTFVFVNGECLVVYVRITCITVKEEPLFTPVLYVYVNGECLIVYVGMTPWAIVCTVS